MNRREFVNLTTGTVIALGGSLFLVSCGNDNGTSSGDSPAAPPQQSGTQIVYTTSFVGEHSHTFGVETSAFTAPPTDGVMGSTSNDAGHMHTVAISMTDLQNVGAGQTVRVTTGLDSGHTHVLTLVKLA